MKELIIIFSLLTIPTHNIPPIYGCMNKSAVNYNPNATINDDSCIILGCTDSKALNYNIEANKNNGTCTCYCTSNGINWSAYCINQKWDCEKCCEFTKPKENE